MCSQALLLAVCLWPLLPPDLLAAGPLPQDCPPPPLAWATQPQAVPHAQLAPAAAAVFSPAYLKQVRKTPSIELASLGFPLLSCPTSLLLLWGPLAARPDHPALRVSCAAAEHGYCMRACLRASQVLPALQATTACAPRLHTLWSHLLPLLLPGFSPHHGHHQQDKPPPPQQQQQQAAARVSEEHVASFWGVVVEEGLFTSSHERKHLGFQLLQVGAAAAPRHAQGTRACSSAAASLGTPACVAKQAVCFAVTWAMSSLW